MIWNKFLISLALIASVSQFGYARALPTVLLECFGEDCVSNAAGDSSWSTPIKDARPSSVGTQGHDSKDLTTYWSRKEHQLLARHSTRDELVSHLAAPLIVERARIKPASPKPESNDPNSPSPNDPSSNPSAGLDPTRTDSDTTPAAENPGAGLDPTTLKPSDKADATSPAQSDPADSTPTEGPDEEVVPAEQPSTVGSAAGCGLKRSDRPCPGPSDYIGDDVPGQAPDTPGPARANRPVDDSDVLYDYLDEVQKERGSGLVNDKLVNLQTRIDNRVADVPVRVDEINAKFIFDSVDPLDTDPAGKTVRYDSIFNEKDLSHAPLKNMVEMAGVILTDSTGQRDALRTRGEATPTLKWSWSGDQKLVVTDWSYKKHDSSDMSPKAHYSELSMALFKKAGVDTQKVEAIAQNMINNSGTRQTIDSIFTSLKLKRAVGKLTLSRSDPDPAVAEAFDAYFRTANGKGTVNLLAFHAEEWGFRSPQAVVLMRPALGDLPRYNSIVVLG